MHWSRRGRYRSPGGRAALPSLTLVLLLFAPAAQGASSPHSARGIHVTALSCVTANSIVAARRGCRTIPGTGNEGSQRSGIDGVTALAVGANRTSLYAVGNMYSALTQLTLAQPAETFTFGGCLTGNTFLHTCTPISGATANAPDAPISYPTGAAISPDGRFLYLVSGDFHGSVIARFARDPIAGTVTYKDCLTGDLAAGLTGPGGCSQLASATPEGFGSGLYEPSGLAISRDGSRLYVSAAEDSSISAFDRDPGTGALAFAGCVSSNPKATACAKVPGGSHRVLDGLDAPVISADGRHLYAAANRAETVDVFALGGTAGIRFASCVSRRDDRPPCRRGDLSGPVSALSNPAGVVGSADGRFVYVTSTYGTIVALKRNRGSGALTPVSCISGNLEDRGRCTLVPRAKPAADNGTLLSGVRTPVLNATGKLMVAPVRTPDGIVELRRNTRTGALSFRGCATGDLLLSTAGRGVCQPLPGATRKGVGSGFDKTTALVPGPGNLLYAAASRDATISLLRP